MSKSNFIVENIRVLREMKGFLQEYMALSLGISQPAYANFESGKVGLNLDRLQQVAEIHEVEIHEILNNGEKNYYHFNNNQIANGNQFIENMYADNKEIYEKLIQKLEGEISYLRKLLDNKLNK
jgi:transcriptional regulator with XRE-family HTH domain